MAKIAKDLTELIGGTPLMKLAGYSRKHGLQQDIVAKLESFNPADSVKDRVGLAMVEDAEVRGALKPGATIIEPTNGNTGVGLAMVATIKGYHLMLTMPETMSIERRNLLKALGVEIVLTDGMAGMAGSIAKAKELCDRIPGAVTLQQLENPSNAKAYEPTTSEEIWEDTDRQVDVFVAGVGTGGTVCSTARVLKKHNPDICIVAVEPAPSPVPEGGKAAPHRIQGMGANLVPVLYDASVVDEVIPVPDDEAIRTGHELASAKGPLADISSGAAVCATCLLAKRPGFANKMMAALLPDTEERYLSTELFAFDTYPLEQVQGINVYSQDRYYKGKITGMEKLTFLVVCLVSGSVSVSSQTYQELCDRAVTYTEQDSLPQAEDYTHRALKLEPANPHNALLFSNLGTIQRRQRQREQALEPYSLALNIAPRAIPILLNRAAIYMEPGRNDLAQADYSLVLDLEKNNEEALLMRAYIYMQQREYKMAKADYERLLKVNPANYNGRLGLATLKQKEGKHEDALRILNNMFAAGGKDAQLSPSQYAMPYVARVGVEKGLKHMDMVLVDLEEAIRLDSSQPDIYLMRGETYLAQKKKDLAKRDFEEAISLGVP